MQDEVQESRVMIFDPHPVFILGLNKIISEKSYLKVEGVYDNLHEFIRRIQRTFFSGIAILGINPLSVDNTINLLSQIIEKRRLNILVVISNLKPRDIIRLASLDYVNGIIVKEDPTARFDVAINEVAKRKSYYSQSIMKLIVKETTSSKPSNILSQEEIEIIKLIANGYASKEIAFKLNKSKYIIDNYRKSIFSKTKVESAAQLIKYAYKHDLLDWDNE